MGSKNHNPQQTREELINGLLELAEFLRANPDAPTPDYMIGAVHFADVLSNVPAESFVPAARAYAPVRERDPQSTSLALIRNFGPVTITLEIPRKRIAVAVEQMTRVEVLPRELTALLTQPEITA